MKTHGERTTYSPTEDATGPTGRMTRFDLSRVPSLAKLIDGIVPSITVPVHMGLVEALDGDYHAAVLVSQVVYWQLKMGNRWIYKSYDQWFEELRLTKHKTKNAAQKLEERGLLFTDLRKAKGTGAPTLHYLVDLDALMLFVQDFHDATEYSYDNEGNPNDNDREVPFTGGSSTKNRKSKIEKSGSPYRRQKITHETTSVEKQFVGFAADPHSGMKFETISRAPIEEMIALWNAQCGDLQKTRIASARIRRFIGRLHDEYGENFLKIARMTMKYVRNNDWWLGERAPITERVGRPYGLENYLRHFDEYLNVLLNDLPDAPRQELLSELGLND